MNRKIIFLDIDGTLTEPGCNVPPESAVEAIRQAREEGHYVFLNTGRNYDMLRPVLQYGFDGISASSGGYIECLGEVIYDCPMTEQQRKLAMEVLKGNGIFQTVECMDGSYTDEAFKAFLREHAAEGGNSELLRWREQVEKSLHILPMKEYRGQPVYKIVIMSPAEANLEEPRKLLGTEFAFCMQEGNQSGFLNGEIVNRMFDKGRAIERICRHLGSSIRDTIAIGDSMNDREMLQAAGVGICMENGSATLKELADAVCPSVRNDGIREAFLQYHIINR